MGSPDYINWPTNGPYFDKQHPLAQGCHAWCFNPSWYSANLIPEYQGKNIATRVATDVLWTSRGLHYDGDHTPSPAVSVPYSPEIAGGTSNFTWGALMHFPVAMQNIQTLVDTRNAALNTGLNIFTGTHAVASTKFDFDLGDGVNDRYRGMYGPALNDAQWHLLILAVDRGNAKAHYYLDGVLAAGDIDISATAGSIDAGEPLRIGGHVANTHTCHLGYYAASFWWQPRVLRASEVAQLAADPFRLFRRKEIAYFFGPTAVAGNRRRRLLICGAAA